MVDVTDLLKTSGGLVTSGTDFIKSNIGAIAAGAGGLAVGGAIGALAVSATKTKKKTTRRKSKTVSRRTRKKTHSRRRTSGRKTPRTAGKGKDTSHKRIRYTKKGQPYVIMASGKARFIKKSSAKKSHKTKGGRY
jgi:hypothetical protein